RIRVPALPPGRPTPARQPCSTASGRQRPRRGSARPTPRCWRRARSSGGSRATEHHMTYGLAANAAATPDRTALVCGPRRLSYRELERRVNRVVHALAARGVGAGGRVALLLPNGPEFLAVTHAAAK